MITVERADSMLITSKRIWAGVIIFAVVLYSITSIPTLRYGLQLYSLDFLAHMTFNHGKAFSQERAKAMINLYGSGLGGDDAAFEYYEKWGSDGEKELLKLADNRSYRYKVFLFLELQVSVGAASSRSRDFCRKYVQEIKDPRLKKFFEKELHN